MIPLAAVFIMIWTAACAAAKPGLSSTQAQEARPFSAQACDHVPKIRELPAKHEVLVNDPHCNAL
jgi:hypothetical protein